MGDTLIIAGVNITPNPVETGGHFIISVDIRPVTHELLKRITHNTLRKYTHEQIRKEVI